MIMFQEKEIIEGCCKGNRKAQKALYDHFAPKMLALCFRYCDTLEEAEDVLQEGFIKVFQSIRSLKKNRSLEYWVRRIMINTSLNYLKKIKEFRYQDDIDDMGEKDQPQTSIDKTLEVKDLLEMIKSLPTGYRTVFNLFEIEGYTHKEIGDMLGISINTSKSQLLKAKRVLEKKIR